ncbi:MAG TPA: GNAT family N-acetyltransferase [Verrucomicrobiae bacterium]|nr:GNAT family N-acetyltransferase [Verrucomicrobiae bacterium]HVZ27490.1 GNAT family N-acetyltransferase [Rhizomicrobium sp.]HWC62401.1 GNAT family N-acetyltransferase [Rhizomicrobium sp.]
MNATRLGPVLETARLILRPPLAEDFAAYCDFHTNEETMRHIGGVQPVPVVWRTLRVVAGSWALDGFGFFSVLEKASGKWIGRIGPIYPYQWPGREVGWGLHTAYWGKGFAREAAVAVMDYVFDVLSWDRVIHTINPENANSVALAKALGSSNQGPGALPEPFAHIPVDIWGQSREAWRSKNRAAVVLTAPVS